MDLRERRQQEEIPLHYEVLRIHPGLRALGWTVAAAVFVLGVLLMVRLPGTAAEALGALVGALGAMLVFVLVRLGTFELVVGRHWLQAGGGPMTQRLPRDGIVAVGVVPARSWRRAFAAREVELGVGQRVVRLPSADPEALLEALAPPAE